MQEQQLRTAIIVSRSLSPGEVANGAAVVMGQLAQQSRSLYGSHDLVDTDGIIHSAISYNVVILSGRQAQVLKAAQKAKELGLVYCVFGNKGRALSNSFAEYAEQVTTSTSEGLDVVVAGMTGVDEVVRAASKGLSPYAPAVNPPGA
jgi:hypothetical protein